MDLLLSGPLTGTSLAPRRVRPQPSVSSVAVTVAFPRPRPACRRPISDIATTANVLSPERASVRCPVTRHRSARSLWCWLSRSRDSNVRFVRRPTSRSPTRCSMRGREASQPVRSQRESGHAQDRTHPAPDPGSAMTGAAPATTVHTIRASGPSSQVTASTTSRNTAQPCSWVRSHPGGWVGSYTGVTLGSGTAVGRG